MGKVLASFPYRKHVSGNFFPVLPLALKFKKGWIVVYALVDSGATISIFRSEVANQLGLKIEGGKEVFLSGVGGRIKGYLHALEVEVAGKKFKCPLVFSYEYTVSFNLLGREEFFKKFMLTFDEQNNELRLE